MGPDLGRRREELSTDIHALSFGMGKQEIPYTYKNGLMCVSLVMHEDMAWHPLAHVISLKECGLCKYVQI